MYCALGARFVSQNDNALVAVLHDLERLLVAQRDSLLLVCISLHTIMMIPGPALTSLVLATNCFPSPINNNVFLAHHHLVCDAVFASERTQSMEMISEMTLNPCGIETILATTVVDNNVLVVSLSNCFLVVQQSNDDMQKWPLAMEETFHVESSSSSATIVTVQVDLTYVMQSYNDRMEQTTIVPVVAQDHDEVDVMQNLQFLLEHELDDINRLLGILFFAAVALVIGLLAMTVMSCSRGGTKSRPKVGQGKSAAACVPKTADDSISVKAVVLPGVVEDLSPISLDSAFEKTCTTPCSKWQAEFLERRSSKNKKNKPVIRPVLSSTTPVSANERATTTTAGEVMSNKKSVNPSTTKNAPMVSPNVSVTGASFVREYWE